MGIRVTPRTPKRDVDLFAKIQKVNKKFVIAEAKEMGFSGIISKPVQMEINMIWI